MKTIALFNGEERGVSNTISQGLLFLAIMTSITFLGGTVAPILDSAQEKHTVEQTVESFGEIADESDRYQLKGSRDKFSTANTTIPVNTFEGDLYTPPKTNITITDNTGSSTLIQSQPIQLKTEEYIITHDVGMIQYDSLNETVLYRAPDDVSRSSEEMLILVTHDIDQNYTRDTAQTHQLRISQKQPPETGEYTTGATIEVETETDVAKSWRQYFNRLPYTTVSDVDTDGTRTTITADVTGDMVVYHHKLNII